MWLKRWIIHHSLKTRRNTNPTDNLCCIDYNSVCIDPSISFCVCFFLNRYFTLKRQMFMTGKICPELSTVCMLSGNQSNEATSCPINGDNYNHFDRFIWNIYRRVKIQQSKGYLIYMYFIFLKIFFFIVNWSGCIFYIAENNHKDNLIHIKFI